MVTKSKLLFLYYVVAVILFFSVVGLYVNADTKGNIPAIIEWIGLPGTFIAAFCLVGVHSDHFILASILANIGIYLLVPYLLWKVFTFWKRRHTGKTD